MPNREDFFRAIDEIKAAAATGSAVLERPLILVEDIFRRTLRALRDAELQSVDEGVLVSGEDPPVFDTPDSPADTVLEVAHREWSRSVREPAGGAANGRADIIKYIREGLGWKPPRNYTDGSFHWCGAFAAYCWMHAGMDPDLRKYWMPSCHRQYYGHHSRGHWPRSDNAARVTYSYGEGGDIQPGDIVMVGDVDGKPSGSHITLCSRVHEWGIETFEGNARGKLPDGTEAEGVVKQSRFYEPGGVQGGYVIMWAWRPTSADLGGA